jgi:hypothetical protein
MFELLGCEAAVLVNEQKPAGRYEATCDASRFSSGVYFYKLEARQTNSGQAGSFTSTEKPVLLR